MSSSRNDCQRTAGAPEWRGLCKEQRRCLIWRRGEGALREEEMDGLAELLQQARAPYVAKFARVVSGLRASERRIIVEPEMRSTDGPQARWAATSKPIRLDVIAVMHAGPVRTVSIDADGLPDFLRATFVQAGMSVTVSPFAWDNVEMWMDGEAAPVVAALEAWFAAAFRPVQYFVHEEMQGVAHVVSDPVHDGAMTSCVIDLGTAAVERVVALVEALGEAGVRRMALGAPGRGLR
jgi:hypothetical protein